MRRRGVGALAVGALALGLAACGGSDSSTTSSGGSSTTSSSSSSSSGSGKDIKVAVIGGESGLYGVVGQQQHQGAQLAADAINQAGGVDGSKIKLTFADDAGDPTKGVNAAIKASDEGAVAIVGSPDTGAAMAKVSDRIKLPLMGTLQGGGPLLYPNGPSKPPNPWTFGTGSDIYVEGVKAAQLVEEQCKKPAIVHDSSAYGTAAAQTSDAELKKDGVPAVINSTVPEDWTKSSAPDVGPQLAALQAKQVDCVLSYVSGLAGSRLLLEGQKRGYKPKFFGGTQLSDLPDFAKTAGKAANGTVGVTLASALKPTGQWQKLKAAYEAAGGKGDPPPFLMQGYDPVLIIAAAIKAAKSTDPAKIRAQIEKLSSFEGALGNLSFSPQKHAGVSPENLTATILKNGTWTPQAQK